MSQTDAIKTFFRKCDDLDYFVLRPLSHFSLSWELIWDHENERYKVEHNNFSGPLNDLIEELANANPPPFYHDNEDRLAEYVIKSLKWPIKRVGRRWIGADYKSILEQGGYDDLDEKNLVLAASGRIVAAIKFSQNNFDQMEHSHKEMLAAVMSIILYHRNKTIFDD